METLFFPAMKADMPRRRWRRGPVLAILAAALLHGLGFIALTCFNAHLSLRQADTAGGGLRVTLVAAPRPVQPSTPVQPARPVERKPRERVPIMTSRRPSTRTIATPLPKPPERQPVPPVVVPSQPAVASAPAEASAPAPAPTKSALGPPGAQAVKTVATVSCDIAQPPYPATAKRLGHEGSVMLRVTIDPAGHITQADIAKSSGFDELDAAARQAMLAGHCEPYVEAGIPMTVHAMQPLTFSLDN